MVNGVVGYFMQAIYEHENVIFLKKERKKQQLA